MIVVMKTAATQEHVEEVLRLVREMGLDPHASYGVERTIIGVTGEISPEQTQRLEQLESFPFVDRAVPIFKPYKLVSREWRAEKTVIEVGGVSIGAAGVVVMAGPCTVES
ncbi:MAG: 3-deoxy-7-phosphoheptulonate synthase, partial [Chloroflexi bacterium]|nr:3-deoxy-7-phosphoheptulonate synthase [Chloroflexota bacterium]